MAKLLMLLTYHYHDELITLNAEPDGDGWRVTLLDGTVHHILPRRLPDDLLEITTQSDPHSDSRVFRLAVARTERGIEVSHAGQAYVFALATARRTSRKGAKSSGALTAPMVGMVVDVLVTEGQQVEAYQPLAVLEAMKVMATLEAPFAGTVQKVYVQKNERVAHGAPIVDIAPLAKE